ANGKCAVSRTDLEGCQIGERGGVGSKALIRLPREERPVVRRRIISLGVSRRIAARGGVADSPEFLWLRDGQRLQHHVLDQREDRRRRADAKGQREERCRGKGWRLLQTAQGVLQRGLQEYQVIPSAA